MGARARRTWSLAGLTGTAAIVAAASGATWHYSSRLTEPPSNLAVDEPEPDDLVDVVDWQPARHGRPAIIAIRGLAAARTGTWGLAMPGGYVRLGDIQGVEDGVVRRHADLVQGTVRPVSGGRFDADAWPRDGIGLPGQVFEVEYTTELGVAPATLVMPDAPAQGSDIRNPTATWIVTVHGRSGTRAEGFRVASITVPRGHPTLCISYRNDGDGPRSPDDRSHLGDTEWADVDAAIAYAVAHGAEQVVLAAISMGGACVTAALRQGEHAHRVIGMILEAPVLDWRPVVRMAAERHGLPRAILPGLLPATMRLASARHGIDWSRTRNLPDEVDRPMLLVHGDADATVPVGASDALAEARPDLVTYVRVRGGTHVNCWNHARDTITTAMTAWLDDLGI